MEADIRKRPVPEPVRRHAGLLAPDYCDSFTAVIDTTSQQRPDWWARRILGSTTGRRYGPFVWRWVCGLRLAPRGTPDTIAGWHIGNRGDGWIRLDAESWFIRARAVISVDRSDVSIALFVKYVHPAAHLLWPPIARLHQMAVPGMLHEAAH